MTNVYSFKFIIQCPSFRCSGCESPMNTDESIVNTNACIKATSNSNTFMKMVKNTDTTVIAVPIYTFTAIVTKIIDTKASNAVCPASMFANKRIVKAKGFTTTPTSSITGISGTGTLSHAGTSGQKISL